MNKYIIVLLLFIPTLSFSADTSKHSDINPVLPTIEKMRNNIWTWKDFANLPNMGKLERSDQEKNGYAMTQTIQAENPTTTITFYGNQEYAEVAVVESRIWGASNTQTSPFIRLHKITGKIPLASNCNFKNVSISNKVEESNNFSYETGASLDFQQAYSLPKNISSLSAVKNNLYVASSQVESYVITGSYQTQAYTVSIITPTKSKLGKFINRYGWNTNNQGKKVVCNVN